MQVKGVSGKVKIEIVSYQSTYSFLQIFNKSNVIHSLCHCPLVNKGNLETICLTVSDLANPESALQARVRIQSASVMGVLICIS